MSNIRDIAGYIIYSYENRTQSQFSNSELKLQKLMYFAQRESLALTGETLFDEPFEGWQHGPVLTSLRYFFEDDYEPFEENEVKKLSTREQYILDNIVIQYGKYEAWALAELTHKETSWKNSRIGLSSSSPGQKALNIEDIKKDAEKVRLFDHQFDMYLDEMEDFNEEVLC